MAHLRISATALICLLALLGLPNAMASILTFDDHPDVMQDSFGPIGTYNGFTFNCIGCNPDRLDWIDTVDSTWNYGAISGEFTMVNNSGGSGLISINNGSEFTFDGLYSRVWGPAADRPSVISGWLDGSEVWSSNITLTQAWSFYSGFGGNIDELRLDLGNFFLVDNLALTNTSAIPLPPALWLFVSGLIGLVVRTRL